MDYFIVHPDFTILRQYLGNGTDEQHAMHVREFEAWDNVIRSSGFSTVDQVSEFLNGFKALTSKFALEDHYEDLLYLCLHHYEVIQNEFIDTLKKNASKEFMLEHNYSAMVEYGEVQRAKELADLILLLKQFTHEDIHIAFQAPTNTTRVKDAKLSSWICNLIISAFEKNTTDLNPLGEKALEMLAPIDLEKVKDASISKPKNPKKAASKLITQFCISILPYINNETHLKAQGVKYADQQLRFLYDLLVLFKLIYVKQFEEPEFSLDEDRVKDYEPKDYIRTLLP